MNDAMFRPKRGLRESALTASGRACTEALSRGFASRSIAQTEWVQATVCTVAPFASGRAISIEWQWVIEGATPVESTGNWR
jgi:hypothetical protein